MDLPYINAEIKKRLSQAIRTSGMTTREIARKTGVSPEMITQYCTTDKLPKLDTFVLLCRSVDVTPDEILCFPLPEKKQP